MRTPSSRWALAASSASFACRTRFPHSVFTKVVRPVKVRDQWMFRPCSMRNVTPVPLAPQTIRQNWIPFLTFFFRRILIYERRPTVSKFHCGAVQKDSTQDCELGRDSSGTSYRTHLGSHAGMGRHRQMRNSCKDLARSRRQCRNGVTGIYQRKRNVGH